MRISVVLVVVLLAVGVCAADVFKYTDANGELHFVDDIAKVPKKYRKQVESGEPQGNVSVMDAAPATKAPRMRVAEESSSPQSVATGSATVDVYMTSWCGYCKKTIRFLTEKGIPFTACDIEKDSTAAQEYRALGGGGVPILRIGSHTVHGYNPEAIMHYYNGGK